MKSVFRRCLILMLCAVLCAPLLSLGAQAEDAEGGTSGDLSYTLEEGNATITACSPSAEGKVEIPSKIDGHSVVALADNAFTECENVTEVTIPGSVKTIGKGCFKDCSLTEVTVPKGVETIGTDAFACSTLKKIAVNKNNAKFSAADGVLFNKKQTKLVSYPAAKKGDYTLPNSVKTIGDRAFAGSILSAIKLSDKGALTLVGKEAFAGSALTKITLPKTVTEVRSGVFADCTELESVTLPNTVTEIPDRFFRGCENLREFTVSPKITAVGAEAFAGSGLTAITLPTNVKTVGERAFADCEGLREIVFDHDQNSALTMSPDAFVLTERDNPAATTVRVSNPQRVNPAISSCDWESGYRTQEYAQNTDITTQTVKLQSAMNEYSGVVVSWTGLPNADEYRVYRKTPKDEEWKRVATVTETVYHDRSVASGTTYYYTVRGVKDGFLSKRDEKDLTIYYVAAPVLTSITNNKTGVLISWNAVKGATQYRVMLKTANNGWADLGTTKSTSFTDTKVTLGQKYTYTVRCLSSDGKEYISSYDPMGLSTEYYPLPTPPAPHLIVTDHGVDLEWNKISGATAYRVFRKTNGGNWVILGDTPSNQMTDNSISNGNSYTYAVRCLADNWSTYLSNYDHPGSTIRPVARPSITSLTNVNGGVEVKWDAVNGAGMYRIFRKTGSDKWTKVGDSRTTSFVDTSAKSGTAYSYTVRCMTSDGKFYSSTYNTTGKSITYVAAPALQSIEGASSGVILKWNGVKGAAKYRVFRKTGTGSWEKLTDTTDVSYTDSTARTGRTYTYTVRCLNSGGSYVSGYNHTGKTITYLASPVLQSASNAKGGVQFKWGRVNGAVKYRIFRRTNGGGWQKVGDTTNTNFLDKNVKNNTNYTYTVRCITSDGGVYVSGYDAAGLTVTYKTS